MSAALRSDGLPEAMGAVEAAYGPPTTTCDVCRGGEWRDSLTASQPHGFLGGTITGQKPEAFCYWVFDCLGLTPEDELVDVFPGSGAVGHAWDRWRNQLRMAV